MESVNKEKKYRPLIIILSIVLPIAVASLFGVEIDGYDLSFLPPIYATLNGLTAVILTAAVVSIINNKRKTHEMLMKSAIICSTLFLLMYVAYHVTSDTTHYGGSSIIVYYVILISHIFLSVAVIPLVLFTYVKGISGNFKSHKKLARITFPIWLYVAISGVVVYVMISPYYG
ncbi:MAG: putative membrane protein [Parvicellaceae bacterium]|jgi:putative membrane protein